MSIPTSTPLPSAVRSRTAAGDSHVTRAPEPELLTGAQAVVRTLELLGDGLGQRSAGDTLVGALVGTRRPRRGLVASAREFTDAVLSSFQNHHVNAEFAR